MVHSEQEANRYKKSAYHVAFITVASNVMAPKSECSPAAKTPCPGYDTCKK